MHTGLAEHMHGACNSRLGRYLVVLAGQDEQGWLNDATTQTQHQVEGGLCAG